MHGAQHFDGVAATYGDARPAYPQALFAHLEDRGVIGDGRRVLEIGAGTGQATVELLRAGCAVTAVEPGPRLAARLAGAAPAASVVAARIEEANLPAGRFDSVVAATAMHWVDLPTVLPRLHGALVPGGQLAVWRTIFGDPRVRTPFRDAVARIVSGRAPAGSRTDPLDPRPTVPELETGGWFCHGSTWSHAWQVDLTPERVQRLFSTFSDWTPAELAALAATAPGFGPVIREHYVTHLHILRRADDAAIHGAGRVE